MKLPVVLAHIVFVAILILIGFLIPGAWYVMGGLFGGIAVIASGIIIIGHWSDFE